MHSLSARALERRLLALGDDAFVSFVADLWATNDWSVSTDGRVIEATRSGDTRRLLVLGPRRLLPELRRVPAVDEPVDAIVSPYRGTDRSRLPRGLPDAPIVDAAGLRERLLYAVSESDAERLFATHLGVAPATIDDAADEGGLRPLPAVHLPRASTVAPVAIGLLLIVAGLAVVLAAISAFAPGTSSTMANASGPTTAGAYATSTAPVYATQPTCDRGPREVAAVSSEAVRGPSLGRGLAVVGRFWNPRHVRNAPTGVWTERMRSDDRLPFYESSSVTIGDALIDGTAATVPVTAVTDGVEQEYVFRLSQRQESPRQGCWVVDYFGPA